MKACTTRKKGTSKYKEYKEIERQCLKLPNKLSKFDKIEHAPLSIRSLL